MPDKSYSEIAAKHGGTSTPAQSTAKQHESPEAMIPPEVQRIQDAVQARFVQGKPFKGYGGESVIASVAENEPHVIEVNDKARWNQAPLQERAHEVIHLWQSQLPGGLRNAAPPDDPNHPYDMSKVDEWRAQGKNLATIPREVAARVIQTWVADPSQRKKLQPWMDDLTKIPLSTMDATGPNDKTINTHPRLPVPPPEAYANASELMTEARKRKP